MKQFNEVSLIPSISYSDKLTFVYGTTLPVSTPEILVFRLANTLTYQSYNQDFGPLSLGQTYKFCFQLQSLLKDPLNENKHVLVYSVTTYNKLANAAYLVGAFQIIVLKKNSTDAFKALQNIDIKPFRDASNGDCTYHCTLLHCLRGLEFAIKKR